MRLKKLIRSTEIELCTETGALKFYAHKCHLIEPEVFDLIDTLTTSDLFLDLGACEGRFSIYAAKNNISTIAVEPEDRNFQALLTNIKLNNLTNIRAEQIAIGKYSHDGKLVIGQNIAGGHCKIVEDSSSRDDFKCNSSPRQNIQIKALDDLGWNPTAVKIDVDGSELDTLEGGVKTLRTCQQILIELFSHDPHLERCLAILKDLGFHEKHRYPILEPEPAMGYFNYWFVR